MNGVEVAPAGQLLGHPHECVVGVICRNTLRSGVTASEDLCVASRDADEEKSDQAAAWRLHRDSGVDGRPRCSGREESATGDWISDADVASRFATNTRVRSEPFAVFVDKFAAIPTSRRDGIFYHVRPSVSVSLFANACRGCVAAAGHASPRRRHFRSRRTMPVD